MIMIDDIRFAFPSVHDRTVHGLALKGKNVAFFCQFLLVQWCFQRCNQPCSENDSSHFQAHFCYHCFCLVEEELPKSQTRRSWNAPNDHPRPIIQWHPGTNPEASKEEPSNTISGTSMEGKSISNVSALRSKQHGNKPSQRESMVQPWHTSWNNWQRWKSSKWPRSLTAKCKYVISRKTAKYADHSIFVALVGKMQEKPVHVALVLAQYAHFPWQMSPLLPKTHGRCRSPFSCSFGAKFQQIERNKTQRKLCVWFMWIWS